MATIYLIRHMGALRPADAESEEGLLALQHGVIYRGEVTKSRHAPWFRKFWALLKVIYPHQDLYPTMERLRKAILVALGFCSTFTLPDGRVVIEADSMAWGKMKEEEFDLLMEKFFQLVETKILPGIDRADVVREWNEVMAGYQNSSASLETHVSGDAGRGGAVSAAKAGRTGGTVPPLVVGGGTR